MPKSTWTQISLRPLVGMLDTRSRPADLPPGALRFKQNFEVSSTGSLSRAQGFERFFADKFPYKNWDHHHQNNSREPITMLTEVTGSNGQRRLFDATDTRVSVLNEANGDWTDIITGAGATNSRWKMGVLQDQAVLANNKAGGVYAHQLGTGSAGIITEISNVASPKVVLAFNGFAFLMNFTQGGVLHNTRVRWSDLNLPLSWNVGGSSLAGFQDLDYGDEILAAAPLYGALYIFTRRSIWRVNVANSPDDTFTFTRVYNEPKNQTGCLVYPNTLVSDGKALWYLSREGPYSYSPFVPAPERPEWLYRASGVMFTKEDTRMTGDDCAAPVAEFKPATKELWFSWPAIGDPYNTHTLVANAQYETADVRDCGFLAFTNYRRTPDETSCEEEQDLIGVSNRDWTIKSLGGVFYREFMNMTNPDDLTLDGFPLQTYIQVGYNSLLRGQCPLGLTDRQKSIRDTSLQCDITEEDSPPIIALRLGNSHNIADPNNESDTCAVLWSDAGTRSLTCPNGKTISALKAAGQRPASPFNFPYLATGRHLYFELTIRASDGSLAIGGDIAISELSFDARSFPK